MNFTEAVRLLKADGQNFTVRKGKEEERVFLNDDSGRLKTNSWLLTNDILANDWEVYEKQEELHTFEEAISSLRKGKSIKRKGVIRKYNVDTYDSHYVFTMDDLNANDWVIMDNED
jgi:hypothetical protein